SRQSPTAPRTGQPSPGGLLPSNRIDRISAELVQFYPLANNPSNPSQNFVVHPSGQDDAASYLLRADHRIPNKHDFMSRYGLQDIDRYTPGTFPRAGGQIQPQRFQQIVPGLTSALN